MATADIPNGREKVLIAARAAVALRSVDNYFNGDLALRANTVEHIERALKELGLGRFARQGHTAFEGP